MVLARLTFHQPVLVIHNKNLGDGRARMGLTVTFMVQATVCINCIPVQVTDDQEDRKNPSY